MATVREVLDAANDPHRSVAQALRLCLQLLDGTVTPDFVTWVHKELDGYDDSEAVPSYREFPTSSRGVVSNGAWRHTDVSLEGVALPDDVQNWADRPVVIHDGAAAIEDLIELASNPTGDGNLGIEWPGPAIARLNYSIGQGTTNVHQTYQFERIHKVVQRARLVDILDKVRTRIASELAPLVETEPAEPASATSLGISPITVTGSNNQIVNNSPAAAALQFNFATGDLLGLLTALGDLGASPESTVELQEIIEGEGDEPNRLMQSLEWAKSQALDLPGHMAAGGVATLILHHFGLA